MSTIVLRDFIYDDLGVGVGGIRARAFEKTGKSSRAATHVAETFTVSGTGLWELTLDTNASSTGLFTIEMYNPSTGQVRWRDGHVRLQVEALIGPHNSLPFPDQSITSAKIQDGAVVNAKINDNSLSSTKLLTTDRTIDQNIATTTANTGTLGQLLSWIGKQIKAITGNSDWKSAPATNLAAVQAHMIDNLKHGASVQSATPISPGYVQGTTVPKVAVGTINVVTNSGVGSFYINTLMNGLISIILTDGNTGTSAMAIGVQSYETSFPDSSNLITFRCYPAPTSGATVRVNYLVYYW